MRIHDLIPWLVSSRMERILYKKVVLTGEAQALSFLSSLRPRPEFASGSVYVLRIGPAVQLHTAIEILRLCQGLTDLILQTVPSAPGHSHCLIDALNTLPLRSLSLHLSLVFENTPSFSLQSVGFFCELTHLEIKEGWVLWGSTIGLERLNHLTHLALRLSTQRTKAALIKCLLTDCPKLEVLVLWSTEASDKVQAFMGDWEISDERIVLTDQSWSWKGLELE
ncbi:hypothetical protein BKA82DRAFT_30918 [Pisolithus tinctorius]|uniref:F-box domain-containing protein n=1 Tax=Pisolithus tinctorius Marx 270 TaxID=870435 RepID=A0A0C3NU38_PISTI|nr:hypothetical protein BKA82DRAFT_30918 [Pisolithus tinctorius]KIN98955.1 hypothetical protein M404DRAFT_30918 [Pisolithus tinctorius Marx 270]